MMLRRREKRMDSPQGQLPPRVTLTQWILVSIPVVMAALTYEVTSYPALALFAELLGLLSLALLIVVAKEALQTRAIGKLCLVGGVFLFYWIEALVLAFQEDPFSIPEGFPISATQFDQELIRQALVYITVFQLLLLVGYSIRPRLEKALGFFASRVDSLSFDRSIVACLLAACSLLPLLISYDFDFDNIITALLASRSGTDFEAPEPGLHNTWLCSASMEQPCSLCTRLRPAPGSVFGGSS